MVDKIDIKDITTTAEAVAIDSDSEKINIKAQKNITSMPFPIQDVITPPIKLIIPMVNIFDDAISPLFLIVSITLFFRRRRYIAMPNVNQNEEKNIFRLTDENGF